MIGRTWVGGVVFTAAVLSLAAVSAPSAGSAARIGGGGLLQPYAVPTPPYQNGDTFSYTFTNTTTVAIPSATPSTTVVTGTDDVTVSTGKSFHGHKNLYDFTHVRNNSVGFHAMRDFYSAFVAKHGVLKQLDYGGVEEKATLPSGYVESFTVVNEPGALSDEFPHAAGIGWMPAYAQKVDTADRLPKSYREVHHQLLNADGSFTASTSHTGEVNQPGDYTLAGTQNPDASGTYAVTQTGYNPYGATFGVPVNVLEHEVIPLTQNGGNALPASPAPTSSANVPDWYPGGAAPPVPLQANAFMVSGPVPIPSLCGSYAGQRALDVHENYSLLDAIDGYVATEALDAFDNGTSGEVCQITTTTYAYYDNFQTGQLSETNTQQLVTILAATGARRDGSRPRASLIGSAFGDGFATARLPANGLRRSTATLRNSVSR